jgi:DNA-binding LacI/PurR family transcriptional regulator
MDPVTPDMSNGDVSGRSREAHQGIELAQKVFARPRSQWPDGLLIGDDTMTRGALLALQRMGIEPNRDIKIATHCNRGSSVLHGYKDELTLIEFDAQELVAGLFGTLQHLINKNDVPEKQIKVKPHVRLPEVLSV